MREYKVIALLDDCKNREEKMNELAEDGWKVVSLVRNDSAFQHFVATLKRQH